MAQFVPFEDGVEVNGTTIMSVISGMGAFEKMAKKFLTDAGLPEEIEQSEDAWYSQQQWLDAFRLIAKKIGSNTLKQIGKKIPENAVFPPSVKDVTSALQAIDVAYHMNHRNKAGEVLFNPEANPPFKEGIGHYEYEKVDGKNMAIVTGNNPYPCDFDHGIVMAMGKKFNPTASINHDDGSPCRKNGADTCKYIVTWNDF